MRQYIVDYLSKSCFDVVSQAEDRTDSENVWFFFLPTQAEAGSPVFQDLQVHLGLQEYLELSLAPLRTSLLVSLHTYRVSTSMVLVRVGLDLLYCIFKFSVKFQGQDQVQALALESRVLQDHLDPQDLPLDSSQSMTSLSCFRVSTSH